MLRRHKAVFVIALTATFWFGAEVTIFAQRNAREQTAVRPMKLPPQDTNAVPWHTVVITPKASRPEIHFYDKLNPVWWFENADEPLPPDWYQPDDPHRVLKWRFRNPFHNFTHYVIGVEDKEFSRSGKFPERNSDPRGGWNFAIGRRWLAPLPFVSYERSWCTFYFGWREHGSFGLKLAFHRQPKPDKNPTITRAEPDSSNQNSTQSRQEAKAQSLTNQNASTETASSSAHNK
jgi:hypothetical protein